MLDHFSVFWCVSGVSGAAGWRKPEESSAAWRGGCVHDGGHDAEVLRAQSANGAERARRAVELDVSMDKAAQSCLRLLRQGLREASGLYVECGC